MTQPLVRIPVGVVVARSKAASAWIDFLWRPESVLIGQPDTAPWTVLSSEGDTTLFYAGSTEIALFAGEAAHYRSNLEGDSALWVVLRPTESEPPYKLFLVTADPHEGEAYTEAGNDIVETVPMPNAVRDMLAEFVAEHHTEETFFKRQRKRANPDALARRVHGREDREQ